MNEQQAPPVFAHFDLELWHVAGRGRDYPRVAAAPDKGSKHRQTDGSSDGSGSTRCDHRTPSQMDVGCIAA